MLDPLVRLVADPGASFSEVVTLCSAAESGRLGDAHVAGFLKFHVRELLDVCVGEDELAPKAFMLFAKTNQSLFEGLSDNGAVFSVCESVLAGSPSCAVLSRVCGLFAAGLSFGDQGSERVGKVMSMIVAQLVSEEPGVEDAVKVILSEERFRVAQANLIRRGFAAVIVGAVGGSESIMRVIAFCARGPVGRALVDANIAERLSLVENRGGDFWWAVCALASREEMSKGQRQGFDVFVGEAVRVISEPYSTPDRFRIHAVEFLAAMAKGDSEALAERINMTFVEVLVRLAVQFQDCSNLQAAVFRLAEAGLRWSRSVDVFQKYFLPFVIVEAGSKYRNATSANCAALVVKLTPEIKKGLGGEKIQDRLIDLRKNFLVTYEARLKAPYGGKVPARNVPGRWYSEGFVH